MRAIRTRYLGPTNTLESRIKAYDGVSSITIPYDHFVRETEAHWKAAQALAKKNGWTGEMIGGSFDDCYVFVFASSDKFTI